MQPLLCCNPVIFDKDMDVERGFVGLCSHEGSLLCSVNSELLVLKSFMIPKWT